VGRNLVDELLKDSWDVTVLHRKSSDLSRLDGCAVRFREVDLHEAESVKRAIPLGVDCVFHVAGNTSHWTAGAERQWKDNVLATRNIVQAVIDRKGTRLIFTSTGATLGYQHLAGSHTNRIRNNYIRTKRLAELEVYAGIERGLDAVMLHPIIVIGTYDWNSYAPLFRKMKNGRLRLCFPGRIAFCHAADVARAHIQAYERGRRGEHYVLGGTHTTWLEVFRKICGHVGAGDPVVLPKWALMIAAHVMAVGAMVTGRRPMLTPELVRLLDDAPDVSEFDQWKAREELGYRSRPLEIMIRDCHEWLVREGKTRGPAIAHPAAPAPADDRPVPPRVASRLGVKIGATKER
jgi:nucleoside-diphosphate-sugar epimerase